LFYQAGDPISVISGNSIKETIGSLYAGSSIGHRIFILSQFLLLLGIIVVVLIIIRKLKSKAGLSKKSYVGEGNLKSKTDLDTLYEILKRENEISIDDIGKVFKVDLEIALDWSKVLENGDLAIIDYPRFGKPVLRLIEKDRVQKPGLIEKVKDKKKVVGGIVETNKTDESIEFPKIISKKAEKKISKKIRKMDKKIRKISKKIEKKRKKKKNI